MNARHQKALAAAAALLALPGLAACGSNFGAQTDQVYTPTDGQNDYDGTVDVLHALVVSDTPGSGRLIAGLVNNSLDTDDRLVEVTGTGNSQGLTVAIDGDATIPAGGLLQLAAADAPIVTVTGPEDQVRAGRFVRVTFTFENGEPAELNIPVLPPGTDYSDVEIPSPTSTPSEG